MTEQATDVARQAMTDLQANAEARGRNDLRSAVRARFNDFLGLLASEGMDRESRAVESLLKELAPDLEREAPPRQWYR